MPYNILKETKNPLSNIWFCFSLGKQVHNGVGENTPRLTTLCGVVNPGTQVKSSGNKITVIMVTSRNEGEDSFRITYASNEDAGNLICFFTK